MIYETYRLENLQTDEMLILDGWQYAWASLGGPLYVLARGCFGSSVIMLLISMLLAFLSVAALVVAVGVVNDMTISVLACVIVPCAALAAQGIVAIELVRATYLKRGWREGY